MKTIPMYYKMPVVSLRRGLRPKYPKGTTTAQLINDGHRTATTRSPFVKIGERFKIQGCDGVFRATELRTIDLTSKTERLKWSVLEGWDIDYVMRNLGTQVFSGAIQTVFEKCED